jgi:hypothetical protein
MPRPIVVFRGENEFEAQMARDVLETNMIPVLHLPSLSTGILGTRHTTQVAVPEDYVEAALGALEEAGMSGKAMPPLTGLVPFSAPQVRRVRELYWILVMVLLVVAVAAVIVARTR